MPHGNSAGKLFDLAVDTLPRGLNSDATSHYRSGSHIPPAVVSKERRNRYVWLDVSFVHDWSGGHETKFVLTSLVHLSVVNLLVRLLHLSNSVLEVLRVLHGLKVYKEPGMSEALGGGQAILRVPFQCLLEEVLRLFGDSIPLPLRELEQADSVLGQDFLDIASSVKESSVQHVEENGANRVDVGFVVVALVLKHFRGNIARSAAPCHQEFSVVRHEGGQTKVSNLDVQVIVFLG